MNPRHALNAYQSAMQTVPPLQAVVMLYDGILVRIRNASIAAAKGDFGEQFNQVLRATDILRGLLSCLDMNQGQFAENLRETYELNMRALMGSVGRGNAVECLAKVDDGLRDLRNAWAEIAGMPPLQTQTAAAAAATAVASAAS